MSKRKLEKRLSKAKANKGEEDDEDDYGADG
jgi:hypothetical protein